VSTLHHCFSLSHSRSLSISLSANKQSPRRMDATKTAPPSEHRPPVAAAVAKIPSDPGPAAAAVPRNLGPFRSWAFRRPGPCWLWLPSSSGESRSRPPAVLLRTMPSPESTRHRPVILPPKVGSLVPLSIWRKHAHTHTLPSPDGRHFYICVLRKETLHSGCIQTKNQQFPCRFSRLLYIICSPKSMI
jgi:hypothetical protein